MVQSLLTRQPAAKARRSAQTIDHLRMTERITLQIPHATKIRKKPLSPAGQNRLLSAGAPHNGVTSPGYP